MKLTQRQEKELKEFNIAKEKYDKERKIWLHKWNIAYKKVSSCPDQIYTEYDTPILCYRNNKCECNDCYLREFEQENPEPKPPFYPKSLVIITYPTYCNDCINKEKCKDITQGIIWCPNKQ